MHLSNWIIAARPQTLSLSMTPVAVGAAVAWAAERKIHWLAITAALIASALIQLGTNLHNDAADFKRGGDGPDRIGPPRATSSGLLKAESVHRAAIASFAVAAILGLYLVYVGGWPILLLGVLSIAAGLGYSGGPYPIAYTPLGEAFVVAFFGVGATSGTYFLCTGHVTLAAIVAGIAVGSLTGSVLLVNNHRDAEADSRIGRKTLAIAIGPRATTWAYAALVLLPFVLMPAMSNVLPRGFVWLALIVLPVAAALIYRFAHEPRGPVFNQILVRTVQMQLLFCVLLSMGLVF